MIILGLNAYHGDASACLYREGELIAAAEEERFNRVKHWSGLPVEAMKFCLAEAEINLTQVDHIAISRDPKAKLFRKAITALSNPKLFLTVRNRLKNSLRINDIRQEIIKQLGHEELEIKAQLHHIEHHRSHLASSFFASPHDEAALLSIDGMGDFTSTMMGKGKDRQISVFDTVSYPHSIGYFYTAFTQFLGFPNFGDEYKLMGLSSYGNAIYADEVRQCIRLTSKGKFRLNPALFTHFKYGMKFSWEEGSPSIGQIWSPEFLNRFGTSRQSIDPIKQHHMDLAASVQQVTEEVIFHVAEALYQKTKLKSLCLSGGVAQNSVANGRILENTSFENLYIPPAAHDAGTSVGAALYLQHHILGKGRRSYQPYAYSGTSYSAESIKRLLTNSYIGYEEFEEEDLFHIVTDCIINKGVIGWFQGRSEFGPRALGNRSILADPRRQDAKELLNHKIKRRESFRPFAPSVLKENVDELFEQSESAPYMERVFQVKEDKRSIIPAVTHVDGSGRLQTVDRQYNRKYYDLIHTFYKKTEVPVLLNTSFNENEPIVNTPKEALDCFVRTQMDMLVLENVVVTRDNLKKK